MTYLENIGQIGRRLNIRDTLRERLQHALNKEVDFGQWFAALPNEDQTNVKTVLDWLSGVVGNQGEIWEVGSSVRNVRDGKEATGNDIDLKVFARCPNQIMIRLLENAFRKTPPPGFALQKERRLDEDTGQPYFNAELIPVNGRVIHLLSPKPWQMTPEEERKFRQLPFSGGPFARFKKDY